MLYNIGEFSRMTSLSIKTLRLYHDKGILIPAQVDQFTGYRYYSDFNYEVAIAVKILKAYDFSLAEIKEILSECEDEVDMLDHLKSKLDEVRNKEEDADFEPCFPVRKGKDAEGISVRELKGGNAVTLIHKGLYETIGNSYKRIFAYINENRYKSVIPTREVYLKGPGMILKGNPKNYLTEIQVMIEPKNS